MTDTRSLLLRNAQLVLPDRLSAGDLLIEQGLIAAVSSDKSPNGDSLDLTGITVFPGFIDVHIHGAMGIDAMTASAQNFVDLAKFLCTRGVTAWLPTFVPASLETYINAIQNLTLAMERAGQGSAARILGVHYEGPFVSSTQCGALQREHFRVFTSPASLNELPKPTASNAICMMTVAPEIEGGIELVRELASQGWIVSLGHTAASWETMDEAFGAGARHMTHFMNAMPPLHHRAPGPVGWGLSRHDVTVDVVADGIHVDARVLQLLHTVKTADRLTLISDAIAATGMGDGDFSIWGEQISVKAGRTSNARGSIAGSVITMLDAVKLMLFLGASAVDVARMASTTPARLLGIADDCGAIVVGKRADLVGIDEAGEVRLTVVNGEVAFKNL